jgi:hypothetical protein
MWGYVKMEAAGFLKHLHHTKPYSIRFKITFNLPIPWLNGTFEIISSPVALWWHFSTCEYSTCGLSNVRDTHVLILFSAVVTRTHDGSCWPWKGPLETNRRCGLKRARWVGDMLDTRRSSLRTFCEPACDATGEIDLKRLLRMGARLKVVGSQCGGRMWCW